MTDPNPDAVLTVDVWSDVACPWCYIGKRRFETGLSRWQQDGDSRPVEIVYHSFELSPGTPADFEGSEADFLAGHLGLPAGRVRALIDQVTGIAASVGLAYDYAALRPANTRKAHQLLHLAREHGVQPQLKERLMKAHFVEGRHVGRDDTLADLAAEVGLDRELALEALRAGTYEPQVDADIRLAREHRITGVPFYVLGGRYGVSGAQEPELFASALAQAASAT